MALGDGDTWDEANPTDATTAISIDDYMRHIQKGVRSRMAFEHEWPASQSATAEAGKHKYVTLQMQSAAVSLSGTQVGALYLTSSGSSSYIMAINTATQKINLSKKTYFWYMDGAAETGANPSATLELISDGRLAAAKAYCTTTASGGAGIQIDVNYNGASIWTATGSQIILAPGSTSTSVTTFVTTNVTAGGVLKIDVDKVGTGIAGGNVTVMLEVG